MALKYMAWMDNMLCEDAAKHLGHILGPMTSDKNMHEMELKNISYCSHSAYAIIRLWDHTHKDLEKTFTARRKSVRKLLSFLYFI